MQSLDHVLWIGGPPGSGKTTIATRLVRRHGLRWYNPTRAPGSIVTGPSARATRPRSGGEAMTPGERWLGSTPAEMLELSLHVERGPMVVDDVRRLPASPLVVAEGSTLPPAVVASAIADPARALWLIPAREFQLRQLADRGTPPGPAQLYLLLGEVVERDAREHGAPVLDVDGTRGIAETVAAVEDRFAAALAEGSRAKSLAERQALLREANEAIAAQVRGYYARPWADGDAETVLRDFLCECGDTACEASVDLPVGDLSAGPVLGPGHG